MAAPKGNKFASHEKPWTNALQRVLAQLEIKDEDGQVQVAAGEALRQIAEITVMRALSGDKDARKEIADRMDGKPTEFVNVNHYQDATALSEDEILEQLASIRGGAIRSAPEDKKSKGKSSKLH